MKALSRFVAATSFDSDSRIESLLDSHCGQGDLFETIYIASLPERLITQAGLPLPLAVSLDSRMIIGEITLDRMSEIISGLSVEGGFMTLILDRNGRIVADSSRQRWGKQLEHAVLEKIRTDWDASSVLVPFDQDGVRVAGTLVRCPI